MICYGNLYYFNQLKNQRRKIEQISLQKMYVAQQLKNIQYKQKRNRRISSILSQIRFMSDMSQQDKELPNNKLQQLDFITSEFKSNRISSNQHRSKKSSMRVGELDINFQGKKTNTHKRSQSNQFRIKNKKKHSKMSNFKSYQSSNCSSNKHLQNKSSTLGVPTFSIAPITPISRNSPIFKIPKKSTQLLRKTSSIFKDNQQKLFQEGMDLQQQNIHKLNSFIRGAYDNQLNQFSDVVNLTLIDKTRKQFYVFNRLYEQIAQSNLSNKMTLRDVRQQNLKSIVFMNEQKDHATAPEYRSALKQLKIMR